MKIAVGTENKAKLSACETVFGAAFPDEQLEFLPFSVESGVSAMPMNNEEMYQGALNRATALKELAADADFWVGLEGGVQEEPPHKSLYLLGWAAILKAGSDEIGSGFSGGVKLDDDIALELRGGAELGPLIQERTKDIDNDIRHTIGASGLQTKGLYTRTMEFEHAIRAALGKLI